MRGSVICRRLDEYGEIIIAEEGNRRTLYFGEEAMQSTLRTDSPDLLLEDYNEAMMSALLFKNEPKRVLLVGLGGCSLVHFLLKAVPDCSIDVVEIRQQVIDLSREFFLFPSEDARVRVFHGAGGAFVEDSGTEGDNYDMIIVDAFDETGPAASLLERGVFSACRMRLNEDGVFVINLWNSPGHRFPAIYNSIKAVFGDNTAKLLLGESYRNAVVFGFDNPAACRNLSDYRCMAAGLQRKHGINFPRYLKSLYWQNFDDRDQ